jgi:flagellar biogenesis protein FliO
MEMVRTAHRTLRVAGAVAFALLLTGPALAQVGTGFKADAISALNAAASQQAPAQPVTVQAPVAQPVAVPPQPSPPQQPRPPQPAAAPVVPAQVTPAQSAAALPPAPSVAAPGTEPELAELGFKKEREEALEVGENATGELSTVKMALLLVFLGIAALVAWYLQKRAGQKSGVKGLGTSLEVLSSIRVGGRWQIALVRVPGSILVVGVSDKGLSLLTELPADGVSSSLPAFDPVRPAAPSAAAAPTSAPIGPPPRPTRQGAAAPPQALGTPAPTRESGEFLDHLLRLTDATPATLGEAEMVEGEQADIRRRLQRYQKSGGLE